MADNIAVTEGSGKTVRTDEVSGAQYQHIKIDGGGENLSVPIVAGQQTKAGSLPVTLASDQDPLATLENQRTLTHICATVATSGHNSLVTAPGSGHRIVVTSFTVQNEAATANTILLEDGTTAVKRCHAAKESDGLSQSFAPGHCWVLSDNAALQINLSASTKVGYSISYYTT